MQGANRNVWVGVMVPAADIVGGVSHRWATPWAIGTVFVLIAVALTFFMIRRYGKSLVNKLIDDHRRGGYSLKFLIPFTNRRKTMSTYSLSTFMGLMFATVAINSFAAPPPTYLQIKEFKKCLETQKIDTWEGWCIPAEKPESCPEESWEQLKALTGKEKLPDCPSKENLVTPQNFVVD